MLTQAETILLCRGSRFIINIWYTGDIQMYITCVLETLQNKLIIQCAWFVKCGWTEWKIRWELHHMATNQQMELHRMNQKIKMLTCCCCSNITITWTAWWSNIFLKCCNENYWIRWVKYDFFLPL
jgi:hypothetical protein